MNALILKPNTNDVFLTRKDVMASWIHGEMFKQQNVKALRLIQDEHLNCKDMKRIINAGYDSIEFVNSKDETVFATNWAWDALPLRSGIYTLSSGEYSERV
tara:strand:+ start:292 stop:594 length:303 start_codon:yes stop_codon:yes gene_type:complete